MNYVRRIDVAIGLVGARPAKRRQLNWYRLGALAFNLVLWALAIIAIRRLLGH
jgi:hypothetical protein